MFKRLRDVFKEAKVEAVNINTYSDTGNKWCNVSINGKLVHQRFTSFKNGEKFSDFRTKRFDIASDGYVKNGTIQICGIPFEVKEAVSNNPNAKEKTYHAILKDGKKIGCFYNTQQKCVFYNICL